MTMEALQSWTGQHRRNSSFVLPPWKVFHGVAFDVEVPLREVDGETVQDVDDGLPIPSFWMSSPLVIWSHLMHPPNHHPISQTHDRSDC